MKQTTFHKVDIRPQIIKYFTEAKKSIHLAIGWLDDNGLVGLLQKKSLEGVKVAFVLIHDEEYLRQSATYQDLVKKGIQIVALGKEKREQLIDHKFVVIDSKIVLSGNFGWGNKNAPLEDFLKITEEVPTVATGFENEFEYLSLLHELSANEIKPINPIIGLLRKLEIVKVLLSIGDVEFIELRLKELEGFLSDKNIAEIYEYIVYKKYEEAHELIQSFLQFHQSLRECLEPPIENLRREIQSLENEIAAISTTYNDTQKKLQKFSKQHTATLGDLLQKILFQTKLKAEIEAQADEEKQEAFEEAKKDHEEYSKSHEIAKQQKNKMLSPQEQKELKKLYRQTSLKCHPDRVVDELHDQAEEIFVELNAAYKANDLDRVRAINEQLKSGIMLSKSEGITELKKLESTFKSLTKKMEDWQAKLQELQAMPSYQTISKIEDWEIYFAETKIILQEQLERLEKFNKEHNVPSSSEDNTSVSP